MSTLCPQIFRADSGRFVRRGEEKALRNGACEEYRKRARRREGSAGGQDCACRAWSGEGRFAARRGNRGDPPAAFLAAGPLRGRPADIWFLRKERGAVRRCSRRRRSAGPRLVCQRDEHAERVARPAYAQQDRAALQHDAARMLVFVAAETAVAFRLQPADIRVRLVAGDVGQVQLVTPGPTKGRARSRRCSRRAAVCSR